jgi:hypothetical protein
MSSPGYPAAQISLQIPPMDGPLIFWWDSEADKSLLVGTFRYRGTVSRELIFFLFSFIQ